MQCSLPYALSQDSNNLKVIQDSDNLKATALTLCVNESKKQIHLCEELMALLGLQLMRTACKILLNVKCSFKTTGTPVTPDIQE